MHTPNIPCLWDLQRRVHPDSPLPLKHHTHSEIRELSGFTYHQASCTCGWTGHYKLQEIDANLDGDEHCITRVLKGDEKMTLDMLYDRRTLKKIDKPPDYPYDDTLWYEASNGDLVHESKSGGSWGVVPAKERTSKA